MTWHKAILLPLRQPCAMAFCLRSDTSFLICFAEDARRELCVPQDAWNVTTYRASATGLSQVGHFEYNPEHPLYYPRYTVRELYVLRSEAEKCAVKHHGSKEKLGLAQQKQVLIGAKAVTTRLFIFASQRDDDRMFKSLASTLASLASTFRVYTVLNPVTDTGTVIWPGTLGRLSTLRAATCAAMAS